MNKCDIAILNAETYYNVFYTIYNLRRNKEYDEVERILKVMDSWIFAHESGSTEEEIENNLKTAIIKYHNSLS